MFESQLFDLFAVCKQWVPTMPMYQNSKWNWSESEMKVKWKWSEIESFIAGSKITNDLI